MSLQKLYLEQICPDTTINICDLNNKIHHTINVHRCVLCMQSEYFRVLLMGLFVENNSNEIEIITPYPYEMQNTIIGLYGIDVKNDNRYFMNIPVVFRYLVCRSTIGLEFKHNLDMLGKCRIETSEQLSTMFAALKMFPFCIRLLHPICEFLFYHKNLVELVTEISQEDLIFLRNIIRTICSTVFVLSSNPNIDVTAYICPFKGAIIKKLRQTASNDQGHLLFRHGNLYNNYNHNKINIYVPNFKNLPIRSLNFNYIRLFNSTGDICFFLPDPNNVIIFGKDATWHIVTYDTKTACFNNDQPIQKHQLHNQIKKIFQSNSKKYFLITHQSNITLLRVPDTTTKFDYPDEKFRSVTPSMISDTFLIRTKSDKLYILDAENPKFILLPPSQFGDIVTLDKDDNLVFFDIPNLKLITTDLTSGKVIEEHGISQPISNTPIDWSIVKNITCDCNDFIYIEDGERIFRVDTLDGYKTTLIYSHAKSEYIGGFIYDYDSMQLVKKLNNIIG